MGFFTGIEDVDMTAAGNRKPWFLPGQYLVRISRVAGIHSRTKVPFFIIEGEIIESNNTERPVGTVCSQVIDMTKDMAPINVKKFICAALGMDPTDKSNNDEITETVCEQAIAEDQPLVGSVCKLHCFSTTTQKGSPFTVHNWEPTIIEDDDENAA